jgi:hypothetical protein
MPPLNHHSMRRALWLLVLPLGCESRGAARASERETARAPGAGDAVVSCSADFRTGLEVTVLDARTGELLGDYTVRVTGQRDRPPGALAESARVRAPGPWRGAGEAPGLYAVRVTRPGHVPWDSAGVRLTADACHVIPVRLRVALAPASPG